MYKPAGNQSSHVPEAQVVSEKPRTSMPACARSGGASGDFMKATLRLFVFAVLFVLIRQLAFAQGVASGDLHVTVRDPKGSMVSSATITVRDVAKGLERT